MPTDGFVPDFVDSELRNELAIRDVIEYFDIPREIRA